MVHLERVLELLAQDVGLASRLLVQGHVIELGGIHREEIVGAII